MQLRSERARLMRQKELRDNMDRMRGEKRERDREKEEEARQQMKRSLDAARVNEEKRKKEIEGKKRAM